MTTIYQEIYFDKELTIEAKRSDNEESKSYIGLYIDTEETHAYYRFNDRDCFLNFMKKLNEAAEIAGFTKAIH